MKRFVLIALLLTLLAVLAGCGCQHEWRDATCTGAKRCRICGEQQGDAPGHSFAAATCEEPQTCTACGKTEGKALGHDWQEATCVRGEYCSRCDATKSEPLAHTWLEATCTEPKHCAECGMVEEGAFGHSWLEATCYTPKTCSICAATEGKVPGHSWTKATCEKPQTCLRCGLSGAPATGHNWLEATCTEPVHCEYCELTQGEALGHDWQEATPERPKTCLICGVAEGLPIELDDRFLPEECEKFFGSWQYTLITPAEDVGVPGFDRDMKETVTYTFGIYGDLDILIEADPECYKAMQVEMVAAAIYDSLAEQGLEGEAAEEYWLRATRKSIQQYATEAVEVSDWEQHMNYREEYVYYCGEDMLFISAHWEDLFDEYQFCLEGDRLTLTNVLTGEILVLTRVS